MCQYGSDKKISEPKIIVETRNFASLHARNQHEMSLTEPYWGMCKIEILLLWDFSYQLSQTRHFYD